MAETRGSNGRRFAGLGYRVAIVLCIVVVMASFAIVALRFELMAPATAALGGLFILLFLVAFRKIAALAADIGILKTHTLDLAQFEAEMHRRVDAVAHASQQSQPPSGARASADAARLEEMQMRMDALERQLENLSASARAVPPAKPVEDNVHPVAAMPARAAAAPAGAGPLVTKTRLKSAIGNEDLVLHLQPVVTIPRRSPAFFHTSMKLRMRDGTLVEEAQFAKVAESAGLLQGIDRRMLSHAGRMLRRLGSLRKKSGVICPVSRDTLSNTRAFSRMMDFLRANRGLAGSLVLEMSQRDYRDLDNKARERMLEIAQTGFGIALSEVEDLSVDAGSLRANGIEQMMIDASVLLYSDRDGAGATGRMRSLLDRLRAEKIAIIATGVSRERDVIKLLDHDIDLAQGLLFAPARPVKADLLNAGDDKAQRPNAA